MTGFALGAEPSVGQRLYESRCTSCHGLDARGNPGIAQELKVDARTLDLTRNPAVRRSGSALRKLVARGHGRMPRQGELTSAQVRELVRYLRSLQREYAAREP
jgi:mono/diheme cytochrome c family protein